MQDTHRHASVLARHTYRHAQATLLMHCFLSPHVLSGEALDSLFGCMHTLQPPLLSSTLFAPLPPYA